MSKRQGRKSASQTPSPSVDRVFGSKTNKEGSASSSKSAESIKLSQKILDTLKEKAKKYNDTHKKDVSLNTLKAVFRRGSGAYSTSHRPTITGGAPNSRNAWSFARVNKFLEKKSGKPVKKAYVQDDDLLANGGQLKNLEIELLAPNGNLSNLTPEQYELVRTPKFKAWFGDWENDPQNASKVLDENGEPLVVYHGTTKDFNVFKSGEFGSHFGNKSQAEFVIWRNKYLGWDNRLISAYLNIRNPLMMVDRARWQTSNILRSLSRDGIIDKSDYDKEKYVDDETAKSLLKEKYGFDGISYYNKVEGKGLSYITFYPNQIKLADGTNTTFNNRNQDIRLENGGNINNNIMETMELTPSLTISDIDNKYPEVSHPYINKQVINGIRVEMEHTKDPETAKKIALDHLFESIHYYEELEKMEKTLEKREMDEHYNEIKDIYENGGEIDEIFHFTTPTGERSKLTYIQQVLVRTSAFKNWFGDWEKAAKRFLSDGRENYDKHYERVSKVIDSVTLEPRVVYHGTMSEKEFFTFDVTREKGTGRPYSYFAYNKEYAQHFTRVSQREGENAEPHLYEVFLDVKHPFIAQGHEYVDKDKDGESWLKAITGTIMWDRYRTIERDDFARAVESTIENQVGRYVKNIYPSGTKNKFWKLMAGDVDKQFKFFLLAYDFDGVFYSEEFATDYDVENPAQFTLAITVFDAHQIKLADGRNTQFNPFSDDIRFEKGGNLHENTHQEEVEHTQKMNKLESIQQMMEKGGKVQGDGKKSNNAKDGGYFVGKSHADGGIKAHNTDTGQIIEVEGNEVIINKRSVADETKREFEGEMLTNREILSRINEAGGGVSFADGGEIKYNCGCNKKTYNFGGELLEESIIVNRINNVADPIVESKSYLDNLMDNIYG